MAKLHVRTVAFWVFTLGCVAATAGYLQWRLRPAPAADGTPMFDPAAPGVAAAIDGWRTGPHLVFLNGGTDAFGHISVASLDALNTPTVMAAPDCERSYFGRDVGICLVLNRESMQPRGFALILDRGFKPLATLPLVGLPIRARVSPDQRFAAATVFVTGESYAGDFTTRTTIIDLVRRQEIAELEQFTVERDGKAFKEVDFNFWGVTFFPDGNRFFATLGTGGQRFLVEGDIARRHFRVVGTDVECPSLSPDSKHLVFKRQTKAASGWQLWVMDLDSKREWAITEEGQDVDDQAEWLDDDHVLYARLFGTGTPETRLSLWVSEISPESGLDQKVFARAASSPSVVR
jgi:hypothetical protein